MKLNIDAAFSVEEGTGATGAVIRDDYGKFIPARSCGIAHVPNAPTAEARALRDGLILASQTGCNGVVLNSDCMEVVDIMKNGGNSIGPAAVICEECSFLAQNFSRILFDHCPRESNSVAHLLACNAEGPMSVVWQEDPPNFIYSALANDVSLLDN